MAIQPSAGIAAKHPAAVLAARVMLASSVTLVVLAWPWDRADAARPHLYRGKSAPVGEKHRQEPTPAPKGPLQIIISIADQKISVYSGDVLAARSAVSTGVPGHPTPMGVFTVIDKQRWHRSNLYSAAPMPYMQRITWSGVALHAGVVPEHPASHGCIRLKNGFAVRLWHLTTRGTRVIIAHDDVQPVAITNPHLFQPKAAYGSPEFPTATDTADSTPAAAATQGPLMSNAETQEAPKLRIRSSAAAGIEPQKVIPISIFVSRKLSKLFVRQGFRPLFDAPVKFQNPDESLGT